MTCEAHEALEAAGRGRCAARSGVDAGERDRAREENGAHFLRCLAPVEEAALGLHAPLLLVVNIARVVTVPRPGTRPHATLCRPLSAGISAACERGIRAREGASCQERPDDDGSSSVHRRRCSQKRLSLLT